MFELREKEENPWSFRLMLAAILSMLLIAALSFIGTNEKKSSTVSTTTINESTDNGVVSLQECEIGQWFLDCVDSRTFGIEISQQIECYQDLLYTFVDVDIPDRGVFIISRSDAEPKNFIIEGPTSLRFMTEIPSDWSVEQIRPNKPIAEERITLPEGLFRPRICKSPNTDTEPEPEGVIVV